MFWDDLRKLLAGPQLYRLDGLIAARLVPVLYGFGLAAIGLWAIDHLFASFAFNFAQGLWGILEIIVYVPLSLVALRTATEMILVFFKAHETAAAAANRARGANTLIEDIRDAIHDLADEPGTSYTVINPLPPTPAPASSPPRPPDPVDPLIKGTVRRERKPPASPS